MSAGKINISTLSPVEKLISIHPLTSLIKSLISEQMPMELPRGEGTGTRLERPPADQPRTLSPRYHTLQSGPRSKALFWASGSDRSMTGVHSSWGPHRSTCSCKIGSEVSILTLLYSCILLMEIHLMDRYLIECQSVQMLSVDKESEQVPLPSPASTLSNQSRKMNFGDSGNLDDQLHL